VATIIGISGSLRRGSYNTVLLRAAAPLMPDGTQLQIKTIRGIPLYDGDLEAADGIPQPVSEACSRTRSTRCRGHLRTSSARRRLTGRIWHHP
jgi:NAD(P)H-dependent FMN reductase